MSNATDRDGDVMQAVDEILSPVSREMRRAMLEFGAAVRSDERNAAQRRLGLLKTIAANVDNDRLNDTEFREFVRRSLPEAEPKG